MSFTTEIKQEIAFNELKECCMRAELSALIKQCATLTISNKEFLLVIKTENATTAKRIWTMLKDLYDVHKELSVIRKMNLKKNNIYVIKVYEKAKEILTDLDIYGENGFLSHPYMTFFKKDCCIRAYLAGCFLACGSCNSPSTTRYHLEMAFNSEEEARFVLKLTQKYYLTTKIMQRRNKWVVYLKASDKIADFINLVGAHESLLKYENIRLDRDFKNSLTRLDNCEVANEMKSMKAAKEQLNDIEIIEKANKIDYIDNKLKEVIVLRKKYPEYSLNELCNEYEKIHGLPISKSGMKHRFKKINEIASTLLESR